MCVWACNLHVQLGLALSAPENKKLVCQLKALFPFLPSARSQAQGGSSSSRRNPGVVGWQPGLVGTRQQEKLFFLRGN